MPVRKKKKDSMTLHDVAELSGFSVSAVSKALLDGGGKTTKIRECTAEKIKEAAAKLGYRHNSAARQLKTGRSDIIGAIIHTRAAHVNYDLFARVQEKLADMGYCFMIGQSDGRVEQVERFLEDFRSRNVDVIVTALHEYPENTSRFKEIYSDFDNVLYFGRSMWSGTRYVEPDIKDGILQIIDHLSAKKVRRIALDITNKFYRTEKMRIAGYAEGLRKNKLPMDESLILEYGDKIESVPRLAVKVMEIKAQAVITGNDLRALSLIRELRKLGAGVPEDIRVTGFDSMEFSPLVMPSLTTVSPRNDALADAIVKMVESYLRDARFPDSIRIKPELVIGESA